MCTHAICTSFQGIGAFLHIFDIACLTERQFLRSFQRVQRLGNTQELRTSEQSARNSGENIMAFHRLQTARKRKKLSTGSRARTLSKSSSRRSPHNLSSMVWPPNSYHHQLVVSVLGLFSFPWPPFPSKRTTKGHQMPRVQRLEPQTPERAR